MINLKQELQNYSAINLKSLADNDSDIPDNIKNSIILYNKALESIRIESEDIAIIELKKAVSMNPNFHEAMNLLGICYSYIKEYSKAAEIFEKVVAAENNSIKALKYLNLMNSDDLVASTLEAKGKKRKKEEVVSSGNANSILFFGDIVNFKQNWRVDLKKYLIGIVLGAVVVVIISMLVYSDNAVSASNDNEIMKKYSAAAEASSELKLKSQETELNKVQSDLKSANAQIDYYKNASKLIEVEKLVADKNYEAAADMLILLKPVKFTGIEKTSFDKKYNEVLPKTVTMLIDTAGKLMNTKKYQEALDKLNKIQIYGASGTNLEVSLYWMGKCYVGVNDPKSAIQVFQKLIALSPNSKYAKFADSRVKELTNSP